MAWYLSRDDEYVPLRHDGVIGRDDFVEAPSLSKAHLKFSLGRDGIKVCDLGSTNGTSLRGERLTPNAEYALREGDVLSVDRVHLKVNWYRPNFALWLATAAVLFAVKLILPGAALGRAVGRFGLLSFAASAVGAAFTAVGFTHFLVPARFRRLAPCLILAIGAAFDFGAVQFLARRTRLIESIVQHRLTYYCLTTFDGPRCVDQVQVCPTCAVKLDKWKRDLIVRRLAAADQHRPLPTR